ncbi:transglutaminase TgpA family protein [Paenibacillus elgii]|uniref:transglutaminase TgpA family protein n=1 Tax=Paenibacillus elgii TaxID=189691 RepID=UPI000248DCF9|nr:transglutaminaseTgpA domain-containing protein [Paenibacillus elgii]
MKQQRIWLKRLLLDEWPHRLSVLLSGLILLQFVYWFAKEDGFWLPETVVVVKLTLLAIFAFEHLTRLHWIVRGILQLVSVVVINVLVLEQFEVIAPMKASSFVSSKLFLNLYELTPYLWFGMGAWVVYVTVIWWVEVKWRIYILLVVSVLALCIRDSFSSIYLWPQVAAIVGCGLLLLILNHFAQLRRKDPAAWRHLAEYPASIAMMVASLIGVTVLAGLLMPEVGPILTDPYTAWRASRGEPMAFTTGKGVTVPPSEAMDSSSGYSRSDANLGGGFRFDYTPVMKIETDHRAYWRGETRSHYTGKGWEESDNERRGPWNAIRPEAPLPADARLTGSKAKAVEVKQTVTLMSEQQYPVLFGAYSIQKVMGLNGAKNGFDPLQWSAPQSEIRYSERQPYPQTYTIVSQMPVVNEEALRKLPVTPLRQDMAEFVQLPSSVPERVRKLAADLTKDAATPYDKAKKLEQYLQTSFPYTNKPDLSKGQSRDFVDRFLFEIKEGYCDYYSTAMVVLSRAIGLPARWVKGYASGTPDFQQTELQGFTPNELLMDPDGGGVYTVRNSDAHSWVEVYFEGYGWIPFEPTAGFAMPRAVLLGETSASPVEPQPAPKPEPKPAEPAVETHHAAAWSIAAAVIVVAAFLAWKLQVVELLKERARRRRASLLKQKVIVECERLLRIFRRNGYVREEHETLREAIHRWSLQSRWMSDELEAVLHVFEKAKYGKAEITEEDWKKTNQIVERLRSQM